MSAPALRPSRLGQPIRGPRALSDSWPRFWHLAYNIARSEFKLKFFGSALGYVWQVMRPLLLFGVLYVFFVLIFHVDKAKGAAGQFYGAQLLGSIVLFTFFGEATSGRGAQRRRSGEPRPQDPVPAAGDPDLGRAACRCSTWA